MQARSRAASEEGPASSGHPGKYLSFTLTSTVAGAKGADGSDAEDAIGVGQAWVDPDDQETNGNNDDNASLGSPVHGVVAPGSPQDLDDHA